jgi:hypothetical protein
MDGQHIQLNLGNILIIGGVSILVTMATLAATHYFSNRDVPVLSPTARGFVDFYDAATNAKAA